MSQPMRLRGRRSSATSPATRKDRPPNASMKWFSGTCWRDRKSTRLNSSHEWISYAVFCVKKKIGYLGAITVGGAALVAAALLGDTVRAVVSRGGRPDLACDFFF